MTKTDDRRERLGASEDAGPGASRSISGIYPISAPRARARYLPESPFPMWIFDRDSGVLFAANGAAVREYGYTREELMACHVDDICPGGELLSAARAGVSAVSGPCRQRRKSGDTFESDLLMTDTADDERAATMVLVRPRSSEQGEAGPAPSKQGAPPAPQAKAQAEAAGARIKTQSKTLLGRAPPIARLLGPAPAGRDSGRPRRLPVSRRADLTADLRLNCWEPSSFVAVNAFELAEEVHERLRDCADDSGVEIHLYCTCPRVWVRVRSFSEALLELLDNAVRATAGRDPVVVHVRNTDEGDVLWQIQDSGQGMPWRVLAGLGHPRSSAGRGRGLGVTLAWGVVDRHGGLLRFESAPGMGTTASIWLPGASERRLVHEPS